MAPVEKGEPHGTARFYPLLMTSPFGPVDKVDMERFGGKFTLRLPGTVRLGSVLLAGPAVVALVGSVVNAKDERVPAMWAALVLGGLAWLALRIGIRADNAASR
jgi:hypothetical protein